MIWHGCPLSWHSCGGICGGTLRHLQLIKDNITKEYNGLHLIFHADPHCDTCVTHVWYVERRHSDDLSGLCSPGHFEGLDRAGGICGAGLGVGHECALKATAVVNGCEWYESYIIFHDRIKA